MNKPKTSKAKREANSRYDKKTYSILNVRLRKKEDSDVIEHLQNVDNKRNYVLNLIRKDMREEKK